MSEEVLDLGSTKKHFIRYPFSLNHGEHPHRMHPMADIGVVAISFFSLLAVIELLIILYVPHTEKIVLAGFIALPFLVVIIRTLLRTTRLCISETGISFPFLFAPCLNGRLQRSWSDLEVADLHQGKDSLNQVGGNILTLGFKSGGKVDLEITRIPREELRFLAEGLQTWADSETLMPAVGELVARNDFETADSAMFVFSKKHRSILSPDFGVVNNRPHEHGASLLDEQYIVERALAYGGNRASYLVADTKAGRNLKLTEYDLSFLDSPSFDSCVADLRATSELYRDLEIRGMCKLVEHQAGEGTFYLFMEPCLDANLRAIVSKNGRLSEGQVCSLALKLAEALKQLQLINPGLSLGSIRPDAIVWKKDGTALINEFSFPSDLIMKYSDLLLVDAPYAAPERIAGEATPSSDLYSIGATMYFALTKLDPECFSGAVVSAVNEKVSRETSDLIRRLMSFEANLRGTIDELVHDLGGYLSEDSRKSLGLSENGLVGMPLGLSQDGLGGKPLGLSSVTEDSP